MSTTTTGGIVLEVDSRSETGSAASRRMRRAGRIPGNVYGLDRPPFKVAVDPRRIEELLRLESGVNTVFRLTLAGEQRTRDAMIKELQRDPVSGLPMHVDFVRVDVTKLVQVSVPVRLVGLATGVKNEGGIVDFITRSVHVECLPTEIPQHFDIDISELHLNQHVSISNLSVPAGVRILDALDHVLAAVVAPKAEEEAAPAEVAEPTEPEVVKRGKEGEGAEGGSAPKSD